MKCVRSLINNEVKRVSDEIAEGYVASAKYVYVGKESWKALRLAPVVKTDEEKAKDKLGLDKKMGEKKQRKEKADYHREKKANR